MDLTDVNDRRAKFKQLAERDDIFGLVNNAGIATPNLIEDFDNEIYDKGDGLECHRSNRVDGCCCPSVDKE